jgi:hypothetical protein
MLGARGASLVAVGALAGGAAVVSLRLAQPAERAEAGRLVAPPLAVAPTAFAIPAPRRLTRLRGVTVWAPVRRPVVARVAPSGAAPAVADVATRTPEGSSNIVEVLGRRDEGRRGLWIHVRLAVLPNGTTGWVPRAALGGYGLVPVRLVIDLDRLAATLYRGRQVVFRAPVGVGTPSAPTPRGEFYVRDRLTAYRSPFYGPVAFGTSARSETLTDWPAGGYIGIHGTNAPQLIPGRVSHGCIRLRNPDIRRLARLMPVGTPITIR